MPRNATGKILHKELKKWLKKMKNKDLNNNDFWY